MGVFVSYGELVAASGLVAVTFDHRFLGPDRIGDAADDVAALVAHVRADAGGLGIDPDRVALWAFSGGGPLLAAPIRERPSWLRAAVAYYAVLAGLEEEAPHAPPMLVARAGQDSQQLNATIDRFVAAALAAGVSLDLMNHPDGRHGFDILDDDYRSKQIIRRTLQFLHDHLER
jgi:dienelactone hydrolase